MVKLRLKRMGRKGRPFYRIVAMNVASASSGQALAELGTYDPVHARFDVNEERAIEWLNNGAQMTDTVHDLLSNKGTLARWRGSEGIEKQGALTGEKPKRRRKLSAASAAPEESPDESAALAAAPAGEGTSESAKSEAEETANDGGEAAAAEPEAKGDDS
ncbi:MAG: 30S ribosomal protein S16 [Candidatus Latescibacterota bacterium]|nr:30S ribosomal protein S16 [Candidatus Latescibacterota bacterium]